MVVKLETVINAMDLAAQVLTKASEVIEKAKKLGVDPDAVGGAVKGAADGAANGARVVADGIGKGFGVAADGVGAAVGALGGAVKAFQDSREAAEARKKINAARQSIFESASTAMPLHKFVCQQEKAADAAFNGFDMPGCYLIAKYQKGDHDKNYSDYLGIYVGSSEHMSEDIVSTPTRLGDPDVYADYKYRQNVMLFVFPCELKDLDERRELLLRSFEGSRLYNGSEVLA
ncbi:hypothetical protein ACTQWD_06315 [Collinsella sp. LCP19S3_B6]|uniref:hypothetical protein n=1 Tax=Collinsella sp. LCP19S3_B6 TaxID=3438755 RepID=UPI003F904F5F